MIAWHGIFSTYGFWLPNDPRGSWSDFVGAWELYQAAGKATKVTTTRSLAGKPHSFAERMEAKEHLKHPPVEFTGIQARAVGRGFAVAVEKSGYKVFACSILPAHVHVVIAACSQSPARVMGHLKGKATLQLVEEKLHPFQGSDPLIKCWGTGRWKVYLETPVEVRRAIRYVEDNPEKEGKPRQTWPFVIPFDL